MSSSTPPLVKEKRFRIAFSFAGEKRDFVSKVAAILAAKFGEDKILYDKYHEAEFARSDLAFYLPDLYEQEADLIVAVFCPDYERKEWCGLEWNAIFGLLKRRRIDEVMLARFEYQEGRGLRGLEGAIDLDHKTPEEAATLILQRLALNEGKPKDHYTKASSTSRPAKSTIPHNLPRLDSFYGREEELAKIADALDPETRTWGALIDGPGGMGKTSLAVRAAYDCSSDRFDRIVFLSAKDREMDDEGERLLTYVLVPGLWEMLNELARELGHSDIPKLPEGQRIRALLDALRSSRVLLILDNLESLVKSDRDGLLTFVNRLPEGCKAILTSRRRIGSGANSLILERLDRGAALATLAELALRNRLLAKTTEAERVELYERTGGKPLLLRWTAGQLGRGRCRTLPEALAFLAACPKDNDPLEFIFGDLAQEFTADETQILCALSYFTLPASIAHLAEVADLANEATEVALHALANRSLVVPDAEETAYALVPMVAEFLRRSRPEAIAETGDRLQNRAVALILENGYGQHDRFPVLDEAWPIIAPALPLLLAGPNARLQRVCNALVHFMEFTGRWDERLSLDIEAESRAVAANDFGGAGWRAHYAGFVYWLRGSADAVLASAERAAAHWERAGAGMREKAIGIRLRGLSYELKRDYPAAINAYRESLSLHQSTSSESRDVALTLNDLAGAEQRAGDLEAAERDYREALGIAWTISYRQGVATYTGNLAGLVLEREDWPQAESLAREALSLAEAVKHVELVATNCARIAKALARQGKAAEGLPFAEPAVAIYAHLKMPNLAWVEAILRECREGESE